MLITGLLVSKMSLIVPESGLIEMKLALLALLSSITYAPIEHFKLKITYGLVSLPLFSSFLNT